MHTSGKDLDEESNLDPTQIGCIKCDHKRNSLMNDPNRGNNLTLDDQLRFRMDGSGERGHFEINRKYLRDMKEFPECRGFARKMFERTMAKLHKAPNVLADISWRIQKDFVNKACEWDREDGKARIYLPVMVVLNPNSTSTPARTVLIPNIKIPVHNERVSFNDTIRKYNLTMPKASIQHLIQSTTPLFFAADLSDFFKSLYCSSGDGDKTLTLAYKDSNGLPTYNAKEAVSPELRPVRWNQSLYGLTDLVSLSAHSLTKVIDVFETKSPRKNSVPIWVLGKLRRDLAQFPYADDLLHIASVKEVVAYMRENLSVVGSSPVELSLLSEDEFRRTIVLHAESYLVEVGRGLLVVLAFVGFRIKRFESISDSLAKKLNALPDLKTMAIGSLDPPMIRPDHKKVWEESGKLYKGGSSEVKPEELDIEGRRTRVIKFEDNKALTHLGCQFNKDSTFQLKTKHFNLSSPGCSARRDTTQDLKTYDDFLEFVKTKGGGLPLRRREWASCEAQVYEPNHTISWLTTLLFKLAAVTMMRKGGMIPDWDDLVNEEVHSCYMKAVRSFYMAAHDRKEMGRILLNGAKYQLLVFTDAGKSLHAFAIFLRSYKPSEPGCKSKVMLLRTGIHTNINRPRNIPFFELEGIVTGMKAAIDVLAALKACQLDCTGKDILFFTDSQTTLTALRSIGVHHAISMANLIVKAQLLATKIGVDVFDQFYWWDQHDSPFGIDELTKDENPSDTAESITIKKRNFDKFCSDLEVGSVETWTHVYRNVAMPKGSMNQFLDETEVRPEFREITIRRLSDGVEDFVGQHSIISSEGDSIVKNPKSKARRNQLKGGFDSLLNSTNQYGMGNRSALRVMSAVIHVSARWILLVRAPKAIKQKLRDQRRSALLKYQVECACRGPSSGELERNTCTSEACNLWCGKIHCSRCRKCNFPTNPCSSRDRTLKIEKPLCHGCTQGPIVSHASTMCQSSEVVVYQWKGEPTGTWKAPVVETRLTSCNAKSCLSHGREIGMKPIWPTLSQRSKRQTYGPPNEDETVGDYLTRSKRRVVEAVALPWESKEGPCQDMGIEILTAHASSDTSDEPGLDMYQARIGEQLYSNWALGRLQRSFNRNPRIADILGRLLVRVVDDGSPLRRVLIKSAHDSRHICNSTEYNMQKSYLYTRGLYTRKLSSGLIHYKCEMCKVRSLSVASKSALMIQTYHGPSEYLAGGAGVGKAGPLHFAELAKGKIQ